MEDNARKAEEKEMQALELAKVQQTLDLSEAGDAEREDQIIDPQSLSPVASLPPPDSDSSFSLALPLD